MHVSGKLIVLAALIAIRASAQDHLLPPLPTTLPSRATTSIAVTGFRFTGNSVFTSDQLAKVATDARSRFGAGSLTAEQIEQIRQAITKQYVDAGYINSGAILPDQDPVDGSLLFQIVEGKLSDIRVTPAEPSGAASRLRLRGSYIADRIRHAAPTIKPLNVVKLGEALELLREDPAIGRINAELRPGDLPGQSRLDVAVADPKLVSVGLRFANDKSPSVGGEHLDATVDFRDPLGFGDHLSFVYQIVKGGFDEPQFSGSDGFSINYAIPITPDDTTVSIAMQRSDDSVVDSSLAPIDLASRTNDYSITIRRPIIRARNQELALSATLMHRMGETTVLDTAFSPPGSEDGKIRLTLVRLGQEYSQSRDNDAIAIRSVFTFGTSWFNATQNGAENIDGQFVAWLGQAQYTRRLGQTSNRVLFRVSSQLTNDSLPSLEQFVVGGVDTVRGYRENRLVRDNGVAGSFELRVPLSGWLHDGRPVIELAPFVDCGYAFNHHDSSDDPNKFIVSTGVGLLFAPNDHVDAQLYYGYPFENFPDRNNMQDIGIHFDVSIRL